MKRHIFGGLVIMFFAVFFLSCSGGGGGGGQSDSQPPPSAAEPPVPEGAEPGPENLPPPSSPPPVATETPPMPPPTPLELGLAALKIYDFPAAEAAFCGSSGEPQESNMRFGCALVRFIRLWETEPVNAILTGIGERPINLKTDLFADGGLTHKLAISRSGERTINGQLICYNNLPFLKSGQCRLEERTYPYGDPPQTGTYTAYFNGARVSLANVVRPIVCSMKNNGFGFGSLNTNLIQIADRFDAISTLLQPVLQDNAFSFVIPKELFRTKSDIPIAMQDLNLFVAGLDMGYLIVKLTTAYDTGIDPSKICVDGRLDKFIALEDMNGSGISGVDDLPILTLTDANLVKGLKPRYEKSLSLAIAGLEGVKSKGSVIGWRRFLNGLKTKLYKSGGGSCSAGGGCVVSGRVSLDDAIRLLTDLRVAASGPKLIYNARRVTVDMNAFFQNPPDARVAKTSSGSEPFVIKRDSNGNPVSSNFPYSLVENFWKAFVDSFVNW